MNNRSRSGGSGVDSGDDNVARGAPFGAKLRLRADKLESRMNGYEREREAHF